MTIEIMLSSREESGVGVSAIVQKQSAPAAMLLSGGQQFIIRKSVGSCLTCQSGELRDWIEAKMIEGVSSRDIHKAIAKSPKSPSYSSICAHRREGHFPVEQMIAHSILTQRSTERSRHMDEALDLAVDHVSAARLVVQQTWNGLVQGNLAPSVAEGLTAMRLVAQMEQAAVSLEGDEDFNRALIIFFETVQGILSEEQFTAFNNALLNNAELGRLVRRTKARAAGHSVHDDDDALEAAPV